MPAAPGQTVLDQISRIITAGTKGLVPPQLVLSLERDLGRYPSQFPALRLRSTNATGFRIGRIAHVLILRQFSFCESRARRQVDAFAMGIPTSILAVLVLTSICTFAQATTQARNATCISGKVADIDGTPLAGMPIEIKNLDTKEQVKIVSDKTGRFAAQGLKEGSYSVAVEPLLTPRAKGVRVTLDEKEPCPQRGKKTPVQKPQQTGNS